MAAIRAPLTRKGTLKKFWFEMEKEKVIDKFNWDDG